VRGISSLHELIALHFRGYNRDGDGGFVLRNDGKVRAFESDELASPQGGFTRPSDSDGVELDKDGAIKAFYIFEYDPDVLWPDRRRAIGRLERIERKNVIFSARRDRIGQTRGLPTFNGFHDMFEQMADSFEAVAYAHVMAASFGLWFKKKAPIGWSPDQSGSPPDRPAIDFEPGMTVRVDPDEEIGQISPTHPSGSFQILVETFERYCAAAFGLCVEMVGFNFKNTNYATMRAASLEVAAATRIKQHVSVRNVYRALWGWRLARAIRERDLTARHDLHLHTWGIPGKPWVDPEVELRAAMGSVEACLDTRRAILARRGMDLDEVAAEIAAENKLLRKLGIADIRSVLTRDAVELSGGKAKKNGNGTGLRGRRRRAR
jgi:capsid protein